MGIGNDVAVISGGVAIDSNFFNGVGDFFAVLIDIQTAESSLPAIGLGKGGGGDFHAVGHQFNGDGVGTDAVLVVVVVPDLGDFNVLLVDIVGVGDHQSCIAAAIGSGVVIGDISLNYGVGDLTGTGVHVHIGPGVGPVVAVVQDDGVAISFAVGQQLNGDRLGTDAILVLGVGPNLGDGNAGAGQGSVHAGNGESILFAANVQVSGQIGGIVVAFLKAVEQRIKGDLIGDGIDISGGQTIPGDDDLRIRQLPSESGAVIGSEVGRQTILDNIHAFVDGVISDPAGTGHTTGNVFGDGRKGVHQLFGIVSVVCGVCGRSNTAGQELADGGTTGVGNIVGNAEADSIEVSTLILDLGSTVGCGCVVLCAAGVAAAGSTAVVAHTVGRYTVGQQDHIGVGNVLDSISIQQGACLIQTAFQIGAAVGTQSVDSGHGGIIAVLACAAGHIDPIQSGCVAGGEGGNGQLMIQCLIGAGIGLQELQGSSLCGSHPTLSGGNKIPICARVRATSGVECFFATLGTVIHGVGLVNHEDYGCGNRSVGHRGAGLHLQRDLKGVALDMRGSLGQMDLRTVDYMGNGSVTTLDPVTVFVIVAVDGTVCVSAFREDRQRQGAQEQCQSEQNAQGFQNACFHIFSSLRIDFGRISRKLKGNREP